MVAIIREMKVAHLIVALMKTVPHQVIVPVKKVKYTQIPHKMIIQYFHVIRIFDYPT